LRTLKFVSHSQQHKERLVSDDKKTQLERFKEAARQLETDDDEERFNEKLRKLAKQKQGEKGGAGQND